MLVAYHLAQMFFVLAGLQWFFCTKNPAHMPTEAGIPIFNTWGAIATICTLVLFIGGFFFLPWWAPFSAWLAGQVAFLFVPRALKESKGPGVGFLSTIAGLISGAFLFVA